MAYHDDDDRIHREYNTNTARGRDGTWASQAAIQRPVFNTRIHCGDYRPQDEANRGGGDDYTSTMGEETPWDRLRKGMRHAHGDRG